jgi:hypothetical protein
VVADDDRLATELASPNRRHLAVTDLAGEPATVYGEYVGRGGLIMRRT